MEKIALNDEALDSVVGGSICFNADCTTLGRNCNNQYKINNLAGVTDFLSKNTNNMPEKAKIAKMVELGYISAL